MPLQHWQEQNYFDPIIGEQAIAITGFSGSGAFWIKAPLTSPGKSRRAQREELLDKIEAAIESGAEPGEVK